MSHDDFKFEPVRGLPEALPEGEHILWQGSPVALRLAWEALALPWVMGYFLALAVWRVVASSATVDLGTAFGHGAPFLVIGLVACLILIAVAWVQARATVYTLTNKRVAMRIGAALTMTLNLPYVQIENAAVDLRKGGSGTIAFLLPDHTRLSYLMTWPHVRPWRLTRCQPALRCIPDAARVARIFAEAAEQRIAEPRLMRIPANTDGAAVAAE